MTYITQITHIIYIHNSCYLHNSYYLHNSSFKVYFLKHNLIFHNFFVYIKVVNKHYQKHKKDCEKKHAKGTNIFLKKKNTKSANMLEKDIKILQKKEKKQDASIITNVSKSYLSIEEVII